MLAGWLLAQAKIASPEGAMTVAPARPKDRIALNADGTLSGRARGVPFASEAKHLAVLAQGAAALSIALVDAAACRIEAGLSLASDGSDTVTFTNVTPVADQAGAEGLRSDRADADGRRSRAACRSRARWKRCSTSACATPTSASRSSGQIAKFQAVQHNLARLAGEVAAALAAAGSAADAIAHGESFDEAVFLEAAAAKIRCSRGRRKGRGDRASGARRDRLHQRAHPASLHAAHAGLARRLRQRKLLGGRARQAWSPRAAPTNSGRWWPRADTDDSQTSSMTAALSFDPIRLPPECEALREEVRAFLAEEIAAGTFDPHQPGHGDAHDAREFQPPRRRQGLDRHDLAEEIRRPRAQLPRALRRHRGIPRRQRAGAAASSSPTARAGRSC